MTPPVGQPAFAGRMGWVVAVASGTVALLGLAPFTPALALIVVLLPCAAGAAWHGAAVPGVATLVLCLGGLAASPMRWSDAAGLWLALAWMTALYLPKEGP
jgi:hypothetical protein